MDAQKLELGMHDRTHLSRSRKSGTGRLVVRMAGATPKGLSARSLAEYARLNGHKVLLDILNKLGDPESERLIRSVPAEKLVAMEQTASRSEFPPLRSLTQYWRLDLSDRTQDEFKRSLELLEQVREVDAAWEEPTVQPALVTPGNDPHNAAQGYQDAAPNGIDARWMWMQPDGEGAGIAVVDIEGGWRTTHEDLVDKTPTVLHGVSNPDPGWEDHGTAVLGVIAATDNTLGVVGTAPSIASVRMSSIFDAAFAFHVPDAFAAAIAAMSAGQILLVELQVGFRPMETQDDIQDLIRLASALGILVVEAAANGGADLDSWTDLGGAQRLNRASPDFVDSGALMVGASLSALPHERKAASNYGSRVDCFAWGENVTTCGYGDLDDGGGDQDKEYTDTFKNTSSASPIIVGAAALVQSRYKAVATTYLSPMQIRTLLSDPATGTPQGPTVAGHIGVMPNLTTIVPGLGLIPDIYLRDAIGDVGAIPWAGSISSSPDVIVRPAPVADPQLMYGEGSGTENSNALGSSVEFGQDNHVYVRLRNRGGTTATNVVATVYWSEVATLVTPSMWHLIGSVTVPSVPAGDVLTVSPGMVWPQAAIPATGHYCFVATLSHFNDPAPPTPGPLDWTTFQSYIRAHNNVTWRNFNVINALPDAPSSAPSFEFKLTGPDDQAVAFGFEVERRLPRDARLELEGPLWLMARLRGRNQWPIKAERKKGIARLELPSLPRIAMGDLLLGNSRRPSCRFVLTPGKEKIAWGHGIAIRQLHKGEEVGRVGWQFLPEACLCNEKKAKRG